MRVPSATRPGIGLILAGIALYFGWTHWAAPRLSTAGYIPVSLSRGHLRTGEFRVPVENRYWIGVEVERGFDFNDAPCLLGYPYYPCPGITSVLKAGWSVSSGGKVVAQGASGRDDWFVFVNSKVLDREIGTFTAERGQHYVLDVNILEDSSRLNAGHPHLSASANLKGSIRTGLAE